MEPHTLPEFEERPEDELAELMLAMNVPPSMLAQMIQVVHKAGEAGVLEKLGYGELGLKAAHEIIKRVLGLIGDGQNSGLKAWCLDFLAGTNVFGGKSETAIGLKWGFTRANVCHIVNRMKEQLSMLAPRGGKKEGTAKKYRERAKKSHADGKIQKRVVVYVGESYFNNLTQNK